MVCEKCGAELNIGSFPFCKGNPADHGFMGFSKSNVFPFEARHVAPDGKPMTIDSMHHLRRVERDLGVVFSAFNNETNNSVDATKGPIPRYRGEDPDMAHYRKRRG